jgi:uncharacterized protein (TIGR02996 family)
MARRRPAFSNEERGLLEAIHADPRDDALRLIYADWLEEHELPAYAEFIRLQCARMAAVGMGKFLHGRVLAPREAELAQLHGAEWARPVSRLTRCLWFLRGLPLLNLMGRVYRGEYTDAIVTGSSFRTRFEIEMIRWVKEHLASDLLARTAILHVINCTEQDVYLLAACPHLRKLELISFAERMTEPTRALCEQLLAPHVPLRYGILIVGGPDSISSGR